MKQRRLWIICGAVLLLAGGLIVFQKISARRDAERQWHIHAAMQQQAEGLSHQRPLPSSAILEQYGSPNSRPQDDLSALAHVFSNLTLLIKSDQPFRMGANEEFAAALRGVNQTKLRFVEDGSRIFNAQGQIVDRWDTPVYFHALAHDRIDIRSAGPDRQMWTADDLHRHYDGTFLKGDALNSPSLFQTTPPAGSP